MAKAPQQDRNNNSGKIAKEDQDDILSQFISDDEDESQLGNEVEDNDDDDLDTGAVDKDDDELDVEDKDDNADDEELTKTLPADKDGNLVDKNKKIIARAGKERTTFEKMRNSLADKTKQLDDVMKKYAELATTSRDLFNRYKDLRDSREYGTTIGLEQNEQKEALEFYAKSKIDPKGALRGILTKMQLAGVDLTDIGVSQPLDPLEVARHMFELQNKKTPPATGAVETDPYKKEANEFLTRHNDAIDYIDAIANAKQRFPHMSLDQIWFKIKLHLETKKSGNGKEPSQQRQQPTNGNNALARPIPRNGSEERRPSVKKHLDVNARSPSSSFNDIGKELLADLKALEER